MQLDSTTTDSTDSTRQTAWSRRRFIAAGGGVAGAAAVAACGRAGDSGGTGGSAAPGPKKVTGTTEFWQWGTVYNDGFQKLTDEYNEKNTGVTVTFVPSAGDYWNKVTAALAGDVGPDVFLMNTNARAWWAQGQLRELTDLLKRDKAASKDHEATLKAFDEWYQPDGKISGLPWDYSTISTNFNVEHLKESGLKTPAELGDKWDWNMLLEYGQKLTRRGAGPQDTRYGFIMRENSDESGWLNFVFANGGSYMSPDLKRCTLAEPPAIEAIEFLADLILKHRVSPSAADLSAAGRDFRQMFHEGRATMITAGDWEFIRHMKIDGLSWDASFIPKSPRTRKTGNAANLRGLVMSKTSKRVEPTWEFMKYMITKPVQDRMVALFQEVPARTDSAVEFYTSFEKAGPPPSRKRLEESIKATRALASHAKVPLSEFRPAISAKVREIMAGKVSARDGLKEAADQANAVFAQYGS